MDNLPRPVTQARCIHAAVAFLGMPHDTYDFVKLPGNIMGAKRRENVRPRSIAMWLLHHLTTHSSTRIGHDMGGRDHTTVLAAIQRVDRWRREDDDFRQHLDALKEKLL